MAARDVEDGYHELSHDAHYDLPPYRRRNPCAFSWPVVLVLIILVFLTTSILTSIFILWPTPPEVEVHDWKLNGISIDSRETQSILPAYQLNVSLDMVVEIRNPNYAGLVYKDVQVRILYRGDEVGEVKFKGERIKARSSGNHTAKVEVEGNEVFDNWKALLEDYYNGKLPLTTYADFDGSLKLWFVNPLLKVTVACDLVLNPKNNTILSQKCDF